MKCLSWARGTICLSPLCYGWPGFSCLAELGLGGTESTTFRAVRWGAGLPFSEKRNADFIQKG